MLLLTEGAHTGYPVQDSLRQMSDFLVQGKPQRCSMRRLETRPYGPQPLEDPLGEKIRHQRQRHADENVDGQGGQNEKR